MSWDQFREWMDYAKTEPFGEWRDDLRSGVIASIIANTHRDSAKHPNPFSPADFVLQFNEAEDGVGSSSKEKGSSRPLSTSRQPLRDPEVWGGVKAMFKSNAEAEVAASIAIERRKAAAAAKLQARREKAAQRQARRGKEEGDVP